MIAPLLTLILLGASPAEPAAGPEDPPHQSLAGRVILVPDGDTIVVKVGDKTERVRLLGTIAGRAAHAGAAAWMRTTHLEALTKGQLVTVESGLPPVRSHGALLADVSRVSDGLWVNLEMIEAGYSWSDSATPFPHAARFHAAEAQARGRGAGLWSPDELAAAAVEFDQLASAKHAQARTQLEKTIALRRRNPLRVARATPRFVGRVPDGPAFSLAETARRDDSADERRRQDADERRRQDADERPPTAVSDNAPLGPSPAQRIQQQRAQEIERRHYVAQTHEIARARMVEQERVFLTQQFHVQEQQMIQAYHTQQQQMTYPTQAGSQGGGGGGGYSSVPAHHAEAPAHHEAHKHDPHKK